MSIIRGGLLSLKEQRKLKALEKWQRALDDQLMRRDCPDAYHEELLRLADEMDRFGLVHFREWHALRIEADVAYLKAVSGSEFRATQQ